MQLFSRESQLIRALKEFDPKAQRHLYDKYARRMMGVCLRYVDDQMTAEDILMEGFMKVFEKIGQFREDGSFEGWMRRIIVNEALGYLRQQKRLLIHTGLETAEAMPDYAYADQRVDMSDLMRMISELPAGYRAVFNLFAIEGYSHAEIADMLDITESTSKSQLHRARACLQLMVLQWEERTKKKVTTEPQRHAAVNL